MGFTTPSPVSSVASETRTSERFVGQLASCSSAAWPTAVVVDGAHPRRRFDHSTGGIFVAALGPVVYVYFRRRRRSQIRSRWHARAKRAARLAVDEVGLDGPQATIQTPETLYELLGVAADAAPAEVKKAYHEKMKICHPDIVGEEGEEMCMLLNDAYDVLRDPESRHAYNEKIRARHATVRRLAGASPDLGPVWPWKAKAYRGRSRPEWIGQPYSRSLYHRVDPEERGEQWDAQRFLFVDEWSCIACRNCCDVAPKTFCIDADAGRARVYAQWGNGEDYLQYALESCPVDCIHWVGREELQALEHSTRNGLYEQGYELPCPMAARQGKRDSRKLNPFQLASAFMAKMKAEEELAKEAAAGLAGSFAASASKVRERISTAFARLSKSLQLEGWAR